MTTEEAMKKAMEILERAGKDLCELVDSLAPADAQAVATKMLEIEMKIAYEHGINAAAVLAKVREQEGITGPGEADPLPPFAFDHKYVSDVAGNKALLVNPKPFVDRCHESMRYAFGCMPVSVETAIGIGTGLAIVLTEHCDEHGGSADALLAAAQTYLAARKQHEAGGHTSDDECPVCRSAPEPTRDPSMMK